MRGKFAFLLCLTSFVAFVSTSVSAAAGADLVINDVTVIPMDKESADEHQVVTIHDGLIVSIAKHSASQPGSNALVIDGQGKFLTPGLVDAHAHIIPLRDKLKSQDSRYSALKSEAQTSHPYDSAMLFPYLREGVTTVFHLGGGGSDVLELRDLIQRGIILGPRLVVGKLIDGPPEAVVISMHKAPPPSSIEHPETARDGREAVKLAVAAHYDFIKSYQHLNQETYDAIETAAHAAHLITVGHLPELGCSNCVSPEHPFLVPMDDIAHAEELGRYAMQDDLDPSRLSVLTDWVLRSHSMLTPTLVSTRSILYMYVHRHVPPLPEEVLLTVDPITLNAWLPEHTRYLSEDFRTQPGIDRYPAGFDFDRVLTRQLFRSATPLLIGADAPTIPGIAYGYSVHQEMLEINSLGLTPYQVLRAATVTPHELLGEGDRAGLIKVGQRADLVLLNANPLDDIRNARDITGVIVGGRWLSARRLREQTKENAAYFGRLERKAGLMADRARYLKDSRSGSL
ncbi:MAG: amidohydrolase family protein [Proteobacteria bacterium]|nr:amidohydrolase family protein [Pseudomonadota bacterium]